MFDERTQQALKAYVYMLVDPRSNQPFYIGKGNGNRVFQHAEGALTDVDQVTFKYQTIRDIITAGRVPQSILVRHGLTDKEALHIEAALIDSAVYLGLNLTNVVAGHNSLENGLMTTQHVQTIYQAAPLAVLDAGCVIININKSYSRTAGADAIYLATKEVWRMRDPRGKIRFVLSEYRGLVVEVFEVESWYQKERHHNPGANHPGQTYLGWGFIGHVAVEPVRAKYLHRAVPRASGAANVVRYHL